MYIPVNLCVVVIVEYFQAEYPTRGFPVYMSIATLHKRPFDFLEILKKYCKHLELDSSELNAIKSWIFLLVFLFSQLLFFILHLYWSALSCCLAYIE